MYYKNYIRKIFSILLVLTLVSGEIYIPNVSAISDTPVIYDIKYRQIDDKKVEIVGTTDDFNSSSIDLDGCFEDYEEVYVLDSAFEDCSSIKKIAGSDKIKSIGDHAFKGCTKLDVSTAIGKNVEHIGMDAFDNKVVDKLIDNGIVVVNEWLLKAAEKSSQTIKLDKINHIACGVFSSKTMSSVKFTGGNKFSYNNGFIVENSDDGKCKLVEVLPKKAAETVTIPDAINVIGAHAFAYCDSIKMINVGKQVKTINSKAFYECDNLDYIMVASTGVDIENDIVEQDSNSLLCLPASFDISKINFTNEKIRLCNELSLDEDNYEIYALKLETNNKDDNFLTIQEGRCYRILNRVNEAVSISFRLKNVQGDGIEDDSFFACNGKSMTCENGTYYINNINSDMKISLLGRGLILSKEFDVNKLYVSCIPDGSGDLVRGINEKGVTRAILNDSNYDYHALDQEQAYNRGIARWGDEYVILSARVNGMNLNKANMRTNGALYIYKAGVLDRCVYLDNAPGQLCVCGDYMLVGSSFELYDLSPLKEGKDPVAIANLSNFLSGTGAGMAMLKYQEEDAIIFVDVNGKVFISTMPEDKRTFILRELSMDKDGDDKFTTCACSLIKDKQGSMYLIEMKDQVLDQDILFKNIKNSYFNDKVRLSELVFESDKKIHKKYIKDFNIEANNDVYSRHIRFGSCAEYVDQENMVLLISSAFCGDMGYMLSDGKAMSAEYGAININIHKRSNDSNNYGKGFIPLSIKNNNKWNVQINDVDGASADFVLSPGADKKLYIEGSKNISKVNGYYSSGYYEKEKTWIPENIEINDKNKSVIEEKNGTGYKCLLDLKNFKKLKVSSDNGNIKCVKIQLQSGEYVCNNLDIKPGEAFNVILLDSYDKIKGVDVISDKNKYCVTEQSFDKSGICYVKADFEVSYNNWMRSIENETPISMINVPGTHDAGTAHVTVASSIIIGTVFAGCQSKTIKQQLEAGIRNIDVRLEGDGIEKGMKSPYYYINHGSAECWLDSKKKERLTVVKIMDWAKEFLEKNPSETIFMKLDKNLASDHPLFKQYESIIYKEPRIPTLGEVRKKVVIFEGGQVASCGISISWDGNTEFSVRKITAADGSSSWNTYAQDCYKERTPEQKWEIIKNFYAKLSASNPTEYDMIINFTSATNVVSGVPGLDKIPVPMLVSNTVNPRLLNYLKGCPSSGTRLGTLYMDFPTQEIIKEIIRTNSITVK